MKYIQIFAAYIFRIKWISAKEDRPNHVAT